MVKQPDGSIKEEPAFFMAPRDLAASIDRFQVLFANASSISQHQGLTVTSEISPDALREFIEATRDFNASPPMTSPLQRSLRRLHG